MFKIALIFVLFAAQNIFQSVGFTNIGFQRIIGNRPTITRLERSANKSNEPKAEPERKMSFGALFQLITMGAGAPSLGEFKRIDENGKMFFELEANNFADSSGNSLQTKAKYFNDGWVESDQSDLSDAPGFFQNLLSGGKLQSDWEEKLRQKKDGKK